MKKGTLLACACALLFGAQSLAAQENAQEVSYTADPAQGYLMNKMKDNWFITAEGGASFSILTLNELMIPARRVIRSLSAFFQL